MARPLQPQRNEVCLDGGMAMAGARAGGAAPDPVPAQSVQFN